MGCEGQSTAEKCLCRGHQAGSHLLLKGLLLAKISPSLAVNRGPAAPNKAGGDGGRSRSGAGCQQPGAGWRAAPRAAARSHPVSARMVHAGGASSPAGTGAGPGMEPRLTPLQGFGCVTRVPTMQSPKRRSRAFPGLQGPCPGSREGGAAGPMPSTANLSTQRLSVVCFTLPHRTADLRGHFQSGSGPGKRLQTPHDPAPPPPEARDAARAKENLSTVLPKGTNQTSP